MGKLILITGENNSGKSRYAERLTASCGNHRFYIATMLPATEENGERIQKHRKQREGLNFHTLECPCEVGKASIAENAVVLLEDVSNLLANVLFGRDGSGDEVLADIYALQKRCNTLVAVSIAGLSPEGFDDETADYIRTLNHINRRLADRADICITMRNGVPMAEKGDLPDAP
ncbi:MAG: bifunctional adenosylcobinamide kinase/adenosylcobinamide-phosphate guanylyltransferase [Ruminiclostridium sp.]|nr:bifunctional adenosylcobinamide kinase/adenosylcobinamide-phosphate guanylyltransferase [Ruminiclostridium sp.]